MRRNPDWGCGSLAHPSTGKPMMTAVLTIARRRPGAVASSASSFFACGCTFIARPTSIRWPDEKTNGGGALVLHVGVCCILDLRIRDLGFAAQVADAGDLSGHPKGVACAGRRVEALLRGNPALAGIAHLIAKLVTPTISSASGTNPERINRHVGVAGDHEAALVGVEGVCCRQAHGNDLSGLHLSGVLKFGIEILAHGDHAIAEGPPYKGGLDFRNGVYNAHLHPLFLNLGKLKAWRYHQIKRHR